jgi:hypothetical protein
MRSSFEIVNLRRRLVYFDASYSPSLGVTGNQPTHRRLYREFRYDDTDLLASEALRFSKMQHRTRLVKVIVNRRHPVFNHARRAI